MNLVAPWPALPQFDVVFCRNVLIYFEVSVRRMILERIRRVLAPGGCLVLGGSETTVGVAEGFVAARVGSTVVYQVQK
jgi:chemotaxis protein methyltransferase CheR